MKKLPLLIAAAGCCVVAAPAIADDWAIPIAGPFDRYQACVAYGRSIQAEYRKENDLSPNTGRFDNRAVTNWFTCYEVDGQIYLFHYRA